MVCIFQNGLSFFNEPAAADILSAAVFFASCLFCRTTPGGGVTEKLKRKHCVAKFQRRVAKNIKMRFFLTTKLQTRCQFLYKNVANPTHKYGIIYPNSSFLLRFCAKTAPCHRIIHMCRCFVHFVPKNPCFHRFFRTFFVFFVQKPLTYDYWGGIIYNTRGGGVPFFAFFFRFKRRQSFLLCVQFAKDIPWPVCLVNFVASRQPNVPDRQCPSSASRANNFFVRRGALNLFRY